MLHPAAETGPQADPTTPDPEATRETLFRADRRALELLIEQAPTAEDRRDRAWIASYLKGLSLHLHKSLGDESLIEPLTELIDHLAGHAERVPQDSAQLLDKIYAVSSADITYLILCGTDEMTAAQKIARKLIREKHPLPSSGGDSRGWMRLLQWRERLRTTRQPEQLFAIYESHLMSLRRSQET